jgi:hypothetical protein
LWSVQKRVDVRRLVQQTSLEIQTLEACVQMPLGEFGGENNERHQPVQGVHLVPFIVLFRFGLKNNDEQFAQLGSLDGSGSGKEVSKTLRECCNLNVFNNTIIPINIACRIKKFVRLPHIQIRMHEIACVNSYEGQAYLAIGYR